MSAAFDIEMNDLLVKAGLTATDVALVFHTAVEPVFALALPWVAAEREDLFDCFQSFHSPLASATLKKRGWIASFVSLNDDRQIFVGVFQRMSVSERRLRDILEEPCVVALREEFGVDHLSEKLKAAQSWPWFRFERSDMMASFRGRLVVRRPGSRAYVRKAETTRAPVVSLSERSLLVAAMPDWRRLVLRAHEIDLLPRDWADRLSQWRGVYLIVDESDGARYVGAAYGAENLLGRWSAHVRGEKGLTVELEHRSPSSFRFSILERLSPDAEPADVIDLESGWKLRMHSHAFGLNRN